MKTLTLPSLQALVDRAVNGKTDMPLSHRSSRDISERFSGSTWDEAARLAVSGDLEHARAMSANMRKVIDSVMRGAPRLDPVYKLDEGQWIDVSRFVRGEPECWGAMVESEPVIRRGVAIIVNVAISAGNAASAIERVGVDIGGAILGLQAQGYAITLSVAEKILGDYGSDELLVGAPVNPGASPLDVAQMAVILQPWFLRRILFSLEETMSDKDRRAFGVGGSYGSPRPINNADAKILVPEQETYVAVNIQELLRRGTDAKDYILNAIKGGK